MSEQTCKTCKHWERGGVCKKITGEYGRVCIQSKDERPWLMTVSDFGCTLWEGTALFGPAPTAQLGVPPLEINIPPVPDLSSLSGFADFTQAIEAVGEAVQKLRDAGIAIVAEAKGGQDD